ncbi:MAG: methionyl-tRNA formyltransferase [Pelagibacteraceae bacterium]|nr:methionyl-tRNA formyltransferase [Pelagibacteraceae bacterium]MBO6483183.1 methionyl-tRNA formyltransferase [Pelagibacteraceae bacterium]MBO6484772.1 methionyl-tRNA formyltransferase [Pelagibacteraceae bacterium]MBO6488428.1 methionyl-tRNA formyltransferase [Pelagibacteraceae bacterium]
MSQKIVFMGTPEFSVPTLKLLLKSEHRILAVYSQPPTKAHRGQKISSSSVENFAKKKALNVRTPLTLDSDEEYDFMKNLKPDIVVVIAYGKIIPKRFLNLAKYGFINVHASLLPKWRGAAPIQRSIMSLDSETGISVMKVVEELDAGPVMYQAKIVINENTDTQTLTQVLSQLGAKALLDSISKIENGKAKFKEQNHNQATYAKKISKAEGKIEWNESAKKVLAKINGLNPNPGAWFEYKNERYKVWKAEIVNKSGKIGTILNDQLIVSCKDQAVQILEIQKEGKSRQTTEQFLLGNKINQGENIA